MGMFEGKIRVSVEIPDKVGQLAILTGVFRDMGMNIFSIVCTPLPDGMRVTVVRASSLQETDLLKEKLEQEGFKVKQIKNF